MSAQMYSIIAVDSGERVETGAYVKYYSGAKYFALCKSIPAVDTHVILCRKVPEDAKNQGRLYKLQTDGKTIMYCVIILVCSSEQEATEAYNSNLRGQELLMRLLDGAED